jgi:hypothetical protein
MKFQEVSQWPGKAMSSTPFFPIDIMFSYHIRAKG